MSRKDRLRRAAATPGEAPERRRSKLEMAALGQEGDSRAAAFVALKYYDPDHQCLSQWTPDELRSFSAFCRKLAAQTWDQIYRSAGKSGKTGLAYTEVDREALPRVTLVDEISEDINWFELRVTQQARVVGFRASHAFFLVFLDRNHDLFPS